MTTTETQPATKRHYWTRDDFDSLMGLLPLANQDGKDHRRSSTSLVYPKSTEGAYRELRLRGLECDQSDLLRLVADGIVSPSEDGDDIEWGKSHIDQAAEWLYEHRRWNSWTHFCFIANVSFGQCVKAYRVAVVRYNLPFMLSFEPQGLAVSVEPASDHNQFGRIRFFPHGTKVRPVEDAA